MKQLDILLSTKGTRMLLLSFLLALLPISMSAQSTNINFAGGGSDAPGAGLSIKHRDNEFR